MKECIFCKIIAGEIPSVKWWENSDFITILDINPNIKGASLFIPKTHTPSDLAKANLDIRTKAMADIDKPIQILKKRFNTDRVGVVIEGVGIDHLHFKLYPLVEYAESNGESSETIYFEKYPGYLTTKLGPRAINEELNELGNTLGEEIL